MKTNQFLVKPRQFNDVATKVINFKTILRKEDSPLAHRLKQQRVLKEEQKVMEEEAAARELKKRSKDPSSSKPDSATSKPERKHNDSQQTTGSTTLEGLNEIAAESDSTRLRRLVNSDLCIRSLLEQLISTIKQASANFKICVNNVETFDTFLKYPMDVPYPKTIEGFCSTSGRQENCFYENYRASVRGEGVFTSDLEDVIKKRIADTEKEIAKWSSLARKLEEQDCLGTDPFIDYIAYRLLVCIYRNSKCQFSVIYYISIFYAGKLI
uniref:Bromo domain-containing protein n=1 Tax=Angiostrongylus cantonensis TaxID=6313 RepID=A0A158PBG3_ANGCA